MRRDRAAGLVFCLVFLVVAVLSVAKVTTRARHDTGDHVAYFHAAQRLIAGLDPYWPPVARYVYLYPPAWALLVWPLTLGGCAAFGAVWAAVLGASWLAARQLVRRLVPGLGGGWARVLPDLLLARFLLSAWSSGQVTLPLAVLVFAGLLALVEERPALGGSLIGLAAAIKLYPLLLAPAVWRLGGRRALVACVVALIVVSLAPAAVVGPSHFVALIRDGFLGTARANIECQRWWSGRCAPLATAWHLAGGDVGPMLSALEAVWALAVMAIVAALYPEDVRARPLWLGFAVLSMLIGTPLLGENYLALLLLPVAALVAQGHGGRVLAVTTVLLNVHSQLVAGRVWCDPLERLGLSALALMLLWGRLGWELMPELELSLGQVSVAAGVLLAVTSSAVAATPYPEFERHVYRDAAGAEHAFLLQRAPDGAVAKGLLIYAHGAGGFEEQGMDPKIFAGSFGRLRKLIAARGWAYACPRLPDFDSLLPEVEKYVGHRRTVLAGASAGGRRAYREALARPARYRGVILLCPAIQQDPDSLALPAYIVGGETDERITAAAHELADAMRDAGVRVNFIELPGGNHDAPVKQVDWRAALDFTAK